MVYFTRHWTSRLAHALLDFFCKHWQWILMFLMALLSVVIAILK
jgi:hypothetical protein